MKLVLVTPLFLYFLVTGAGNVHATTCNPACTDDNICDKVQEKCLIKAGKSCATRGENKCVSGASCDKDLCKCGDGYTEDGEICKPKISGTVGTTCTSGNTECTTPNSICSNFLACKCKTDFLLNIDNGQCDGKLETACKEGDTCVVSTVCDKVAEKCLIKHDQSCTDHSNKCVSNASCDQSLCKCDANKAVSASTGLCRLKTSQSCTVENCVVGAICKDSTCQCDVAKAVSSNTGLCLLKAGQVCEEDICVYGATCQSSRCQCNDRYVENSITKLCDAKPGTACSADVVCVASSVCESGTCYAKPGTTCSEDAPCVASSVCKSGTCLIKHGQSCSDNTDKCVPNAVCLENVCKCDASSVDLPSGLCTLKSESSASGTHFFWLLLVALMTLTQADCVM